jgi:hypothetical protein
MRLHSGKVVIYPYDGFEDLVRGTATHSTRIGLDLDVPLKTAQDWVYRGGVPSSE